MNPLAIPPTKLLTECLAPEQARVFVELVRSLCERAGRESIEIRDAEGTVLGFLVLLTPHASPDDAPESAEFLEELERRMQSPEPVLPAEVVLALLEDDRATVEPLTPN